MANRLLTVATRRFANKVDPVTRVLSAPVSSEVRKDLPAELDGQLGAYKKDPNYVGMTDKEELRAGVAQSIAVNDPYRFTALDEFGRKTYDADQDAVGCYKGAETGGSNGDNLGGFDIMQFEKWNQAEWQKQRTARVKFETQSASHLVSTGQSFTSRGGPWCIELETFGEYKGHNAGENQSFDPMRNIVLFGFKTQAEAVAHCQSMGWAFDVEVPRVRKHLKKSYAGNFAWKGHPTEKKKYY